MPAAIKESSLVMSVPSARKDRLSATWTATPTPVPDPPMPTAAVASRHRVPALTPHSVSEGCARQQKGSRRPGGGVTTRRWSGAC
jgi:hypothetical protein